MAALVRSLVLAAACGCCCWFLLLASLPVAGASSAAGTETLVGIVGKDFVLLGADSSVSQSIALTASNLDKIAHLVDPFPEHGGENSGGGGSDPSATTTTQHSPGTIHWQQSILAAAAGDAADSDRLLGYLKAFASLEEYQNGGWGCDVRVRSLGDENLRPAFGKAGLTVRSLAHLARRCIWDRLRSRTPYRVCLLVAGMMPMMDDDEAWEDDGEDESPYQTAAFLSQRVQNQVRQAWGSGSSKDNHEEEDEVASVTPHEGSSPSSYYRPHLYWLDEYGSLQKIEYGAHGHGSNFLLSILDQRFRDDLTREEAIALMNECFRELRNRYVINSPEAPCIKCVDAHGVSWVPPTTTTEQSEDRSANNRNTFVR